MSRLTFLMQRYAENSITSEELEEFFNAVNLLSNNEIISELMRADENMTLVSIERTNEEWKNNWEAIKFATLQKEESVRKYSTFNTIWFRYAAVFILSLSVGGYFWFQNDREQPLISDNRNSQEDIAPGTEGAILTLADGSQVVLDSLSDGLIAAQNGAQVMLKNGQITYATTGTETPEIAYNTMSTPKGRQFQMTLPDGTRVWLNAASSIQYPTIFTGIERQVNIIGEVYFEVAMNKRMPFRVNVNNQAEIDVLGTHFNVNAYENEKSLRTTLLEGSVKVNGMIIKPGQQAQVFASGATANHPANTPDLMQVVNVVDMDRVMAWKYGFINFEDATLDEIMKQLERWYDLEVVYEGVAPNIKFKGRMPRNTPLSTVLKGFQYMGVEYRLDGKKILVRS